MPGSELTHNTMSAGNNARSIYHTLSRVTSGGGAASLRAVFEPIARKDARLFEAFSYPWTPSSTFDTLLEIARPFLEPEYR